MNGLFNLLMPGLGQFCQGRIGWGCFFLFAFIFQLMLTVISLAFAIFTVFTLPATVIWSVIDAAAEDKYQREMADWRRNKLLRELIDSRPNG